MVDSIIYQARSLMTNATREQSSGGKAPAGPRNHPSPPALISVRLPIFSTGVNTWVHLLLPEG
ncbi:MAG TPA: hypothetical protein VK633_15130, partial [Verrucomicrobiae bacterium]|nr:hypothetical protein [Verrucomicrobiae bacterium]